jgi:hypothetical protein
VLPILIKYLFQNGRVCIPHIGTIEIVQEVPQLDVADKLLIPPFFKTVFSENDHIPEHQLRFISLANHTPKKELLSFGEKLRDRVHEEPVNLNGIGILSYNANSIVFEPEEIYLSSLQPVPAQKVTRENVQHNVLIGDREVSKLATDVPGKSRQKRSLVLTIGWIVLGVAVTAIGVLLYLGKFQVSSTGLKLHP